MSQSSNSVGAGGMSPGCYLQTFGISIHHNQKHLAKIRPNLHAIVSMAHLARAMKQLGRMLVIWQILDKQDIISLSPQFAYQVKTAKTTFQLIVHFNHTQVFCMQIGQ